MVRFGPFTLDTTGRLLTREDARLHLTPKAFDLLALLVSEAPRVLNKAELHQRLWPGTFVSDATLAGLVKEVRRALGDRDSTHRLIRTVHRVGYAFAGALERSSEPAPGSSWHWLVLNGRRLALHGGKNVIGRDPGCDVCLEAAGISRRHACIAVDGTVARLEDLGSKNGTSVRDARITTPVLLHDGDRVTFGSSVAVYRASDAGISTQTQTPSATRTRPQTAGHGHA
jgi:DNA-binding winged helix-turn-helix (wHTH) protein